MDLDREGGDLLLAAHLPLLDSAAARRRTLHNTAASHWRHPANTTDGSGSTTNTAPCIHHSSVVPTTVMS